MLYYNKFNCMDYAFEYTHPIRIDEWSYPLDMAIITDSVYEYASEDLDKVLYFMSGCKEWIKEDIKNG